MPVNPTEEEQRALARRAKGGSDFDWPMLRDWMLLVLILTHLLGHPS